jgi:hypothetical protein
MSKQFWFRIRILGWIILLVWYIIYAVNAVHPLVQYPWISVLQGIVGVAATLLIMVGYYDLERKIRKANKEE